MNDLALGGTEHLLARHVQQLSKDYPEISNEVVALGREDMAYGEYLAMLPVTPQFLGYSGRYRNPAASLRCIRQLRRVIRKASPDVIHTYLWNADVFGVLARRGLGAPHLAHVVDRRGNRGASRWTARGKTYFTGWLHRQYGTRFVAVSDACSAHAKRNLLITADSIVTAHNGIPVEAFSVASRHVAEDRPVVVGTMSNLHVEKGHRYLLEAFVRLVATQVPVSLRIAGSGRRQGELEHMADNLGIAEFVEFDGRVPSAADFYRDIDLFVVPSIYAEGLPTTILEAMAAQLPIVATDVGGASEAIRNGNEGWIVTPRDGTALAAAILSLVQDRTLMRRMGEAGYRRVCARFTVAQMTRTIVETCYGPLLQRPAGAFAIESGRSGN